ncbi:hypothetical protein ACFFRR_009468 [Megaselia abdita]
MTSKYEKFKFTGYRLKFNWYYAPLFVAFWFVLFYVSVIPSFYNYPTIVTVEDEQTNFEKFEDIFVGERSERDLFDLSRIGTKLVGTPANEQSAVQFLTDRIEKIIAESRQDLYDIEYDIQEATGSYVIFKMVNYYQSIQNVVVKFSTKDSNSTNYLLINSHYDTVAESTGAGDAGIMITTMLEVLRKLSKSSNILRHPIIFLFNGAEENPLQGSHAFISQHKWANNIKALINLDSAGCGGREILFQSGPNHPWLMKYYKKFAKHPYASTIGEELFQNDFIPSDTDFRIFRDYGEIPGLDMAHTQNGYVYHSKYDRFNVMPTGTFQTTGDNVLALARGIANAPEMDNPAKHAVGHTVFFDYLGWFLVFYSEEDGIIINVIVSLCALLSIGLSIWSTKKNTEMEWKKILIAFSIIFGLQLLAVIIAFGVAILLALFIDAVGISMSWFSSTWMVLGLYYCPMFFVLGIIPAIYLTKTKNSDLFLANGVQFFMHSQCIILVVITFIMTGLGIRSGFIFMIATFFYTISVIINLMTDKLQTAYLWFITHCICQMFPFMFYTYCAYAFYVTYVPMQGRDGPEGNPEIMIVSFTALMCILFGGFICPLINMFRKNKIIIGISGVITIIFLIIAATPAGFPYEDKIHPQRYYAVHTSRTFHKADLSIEKNESGFFVMPVDRRYNSAKDVLLHKEDIQDLNEDCNNHVMCGMPIWNARWIGWKYVFLKTFCFNIKLKSFF